MDPPLPESCSIYSFFFLNRISPRGPKFESQNLNFFGWFLQKKNCMDSGRKKPFCGGTGTGGDDFSVTGSSEGFL